MASDEVTYTAGGSVVDQKIKNAAADPDHHAGVDFAYDGAGRLTAAHVPGRTITYAFTEDTSSPCGWCCAPPSSVSGDTGDATLDGLGTVVEATIALIGGVMLTTRTTGNVWSYPNIHGDVMITANASGVKQGSVLNYDPYGQALSTVPDNSAGNFDYGWLGQHQRPSRPRSAWPPSRWALDRTCRGSAASCRSTPSKAGRRTTTTTSTPTRSTTSTWTGRSVARSGRRTGYAATGRRRCVWRAGTQGVEETSSAPALTTAPCRSTVAQSPVSLCFTAPAAVGLAWA